MRLLFALLISSVAFGHSDTRSGSGITGIQYESLIENIQQLSAKHSDYSQIHDYGTSVRGRTLRMIGIYDKTIVSKSRPMIGITGAIHGNEYLNIVDRLPENFLKNRKNSSLNAFLKKGGAIFIVPVFNPDGYASRMRTNANGVDLNRDWDIPTISHTGFRQPETKQYRDVMLKLKQEMGLEFDLFVEYHCCGRSLLHPWAHSSRPIPSADLQAHQQIGELARQAMGQIPVGNDAQVFGSTPRGTSNDWFYDVFGGLGFAFEGAQGSENKYLDQHLEWWESIFAQM